MMDIRKMLSMSTKTDCYLFKKYEKNSKNHPIELGSFESSLER